MQPVVEVFELREHAHALTDHLLTGFASPELEAVKQAVGGADGLIAVSPTFSTSYNGLFKTFFDVPDAGAIAGTPVLLAATVAGHEPKTVADPFADVASFQELFGN